MTLKYIEGFETYNNTTLDASFQDRYFGNWSVQKSLAPTTGRYHGYGIQVGSNGSSGDFFYTYNLGSTNTWIVGFAFNRRATDDGGAHTWTGKFLEIRNSFSVACSIHHGNGSVLLKNAGGTTLHTWSSITESTGWRHYAFKFVVNGASSSCEFKWNNVSQGSSGTETFSQSTANNFGFFGMDSSTGISHYFDDIYVCDGQGSTNNDFLGNCVVENLIATGNGTYTDWTGSYTDIDERPSNQADSIIAYTPGDRETFVMSDLAVINGDVKGVQQNTYTYGMGVYDLRMTQRVSGTNYDSSNILPYDLLDGSNTYKFGISEAADLSSTAWTTSSVNASEFGVLLANP